MLRKGPKALCRTEPEERLSLDQLDRLVDRIYEAAAISEFWPAVLDDIARFTESDSASFHSVRDHTVRAIGTPAANWLIEEFRPFAKTIVNTRTTRGRGRAEFGFLTDFDMFTPEELAREPFYRDFLYPRGFGWFAGTTFDVPTGARADRAPRRGAERSASSRRRQRSDARTHSRRIRGPAGVLVRRR